MWTAFFRITLAVAAALTGVMLLVFGDRAVKDYFAKNLETRNRLQALQTTLYALEGEVLRNGSYLYYSYDRINRLLKEGDRLLETLRYTPHLQTEFHWKTRTLLKTLREKFTDYAADIQQYLTINASLKNSTVYLPTLQLRAFRLFDSSRQADRKALLTIAKINASIFLARNAQDIDFLTDIQTYSGQLTRLADQYEGPQKRLLNTLVSHLRQFDESFPVYIRYFTSLLREDPIPYVTSIIDQFQKESAEELKLLNQTTLILLVLYLISLAVVIYFILRTYRENRHLRRLKEELEKALITDTLTGLENRLAYRRKKSKMRHPALILINIDRFKHINDFYGSRIGDGVLQETARVLRRITPPSLDASLFRMGGDDFGILFERENSSRQFITLVKSYQEKLQECSVVVEDLTIDLSFAIGASEKSDWLFETADMALKAAKNSQRKRYSLYDSNLDNREEIARNIQALRNIRHAINRHNLIPYFQPICSTKNRQIHKFEALARIELDDSNHILHPYSFIHAANEAKLSGEITIQILRKTLQTARDYPDYEFSVNLGAEDILNAEDRERIIAMLSENNDLCNRIVFEILESEEIKDYETTAEFISTVKRFGCRIAIDDFGSGYSNFEKILMLDIDMLKIDGSLIRRIDRDRHSELIVRTILSFARQARWETIAEFVHSRAVYDKVIAMGFDYVQGYYVGKPLKNPDEHLTHYPHHQSPDT